MVLDGFDRGFVVRVAVRRGRGRERRLGRRRPRARRGRFPRGWGGVPRAGRFPRRGGGASCVVIVTRECLAREGPSHRVRGVARGRRARELLKEGVRVLGFESGDDLLRPRADVFSQRQPDARDDLGQPRHLALLVLDLPRVALNGVEQTAREPGVSGHLGHDVVEEPERRFLQEVLRELRGSGRGLGQRSRRSKAVERRSLKR